YRSGYREFFLTPSKPTATPRKPRAAGQGGLPPAERLRTGAYAQMTPDPAILKVQLLPGGRPLNLDRSGRFDAWLAREPEPISRGDAPTSKTALLLSAFNALPVLIPNGEGLKYKTFAEAGEKLNEIAGYLQQAGYKVEGPHTDAGVS